jgi:hypothetical protein
MHFSVAEQNRRLHALRTVMDEQGYAALLIPGQAEATQRGYLRYISNHRLWGGKGFVLVTPTTDPILILGAGSRVITYVRNMAFCAARRTASSEPARAFFAGGGFAAAREEDDEAPAAAAVRAAVHSFFRCFKETAVNLAGDVATVCKAASIMSLKELAAMERKAEAKTLWPTGLSLTAVKRSRTDCHSFSALMHCSQSSAGSKILA